MNPGVSILIATYARTHLLRESIYSALHQLYAGPLEVIVLNACPLQTLVCPGVRVINAPEMADTPLGAVRDRLIKSATQPLCCLWDDDDLYLPNHVASVVAKLRDGEPAARMTSMATWDGAQFRSRGGSTNAAHTVVFRRAAYGVWPVAFDPQADADCADMQFWARAHKSGWFQGRHHHGQDGVITTILRMESDRVRASQTEIGCLKPETLRALWRARVQNGEEPAGSVTITPAWSRDWTAAVDHLQVRP